MKQVSLIILNLLFPVLLLGQSLSEVTVKRERIFTGTGLYGFMNGGSDLYLEYGFEKLTTRDVTYQDEDYTVDIYEMSSTENAFGIYSLHAFKCLRADTLDLINCQSTYQLQAALGNKYVSIVFQSGSSKARQNADNLLRLYIDISDSDKIVIPEEIEIAPPYSSFLKYLKGSLSVSNAQPSLLKWLKDISYSEIWLVIDKVTKENKALIRVLDNTNYEKLKRIIPKAEIIKEGDLFIYAKCPQKEAPTEDYGSFGF